MTIYFCDKCAKEKDLPKKFRKTFHKCDICGAERNCNDDKPVKGYKK
jgi:hypothetical protein